MFVGFVSFVGEDVSLRTRGNTDTVHSQISFPILAENRIKQEAETCRAIAFVYTSSQYEVSWYHHVSPYPTVQVSITCNKRPSQKKKEKKGRPTMSHLKIIQPTEKSKKNHESYRIPSS